MRAASIALLVVAGCAKKAPTPPAAVDPVPQVAQSTGVFAPDSVGVNWNLALRDGALTTYTVGERALPSTVDFTFFDGLLTAEDHEAGRFCMLQMPMATAVASEELEAAWLQFAMPAAEPANQMGSCDAAGELGAPPLDWLANQTIVVGVGPISDAMRAQVAKMWPNYGGTWGDSLEEAQPYLVGGPILMDGEVWDWAFGMATRLDESGAILFEGDQPVRVPAAEIEQVSGAVLLNLFGYRPQLLSE